MPKRILFQFDADPQPSSFDAVVAIDAGVDHLIPYSAVQPTWIEPLVHGAMFTRGGDDLNNTAIFLGGTDVSVVETLLRCVTETFFGGVRVSVMMDANGCNTTAAAAVIAASRHVPLAGANALVLGGTGPVGGRVARLLACDGTNVTLTSRSHARAQQMCDRIRNQVGDASIGGLDPAVLDLPGESSKLFEKMDIVVACGAAGVQLATCSQLDAASELKVAIDLNAVPPAGLNGIEVTDKAKPFGEHPSAVAYGAIGVGGLKMKTHRAAIRSLFESNDKVLDADQIYAIAKRVESS